MDPSGDLPSVWRVSLAEDEQQTAQQSLSHIPGAQAAGQLTQQGQEVLANQAGGGQQQAGQQHSKQQREQWCGHGRVSDSKTVQSPGLPFLLPLHLAKTWGAEFPPPSVSAIMLPGLHLMRHVAFLKPFLLVR